MKFKLALVALAAAASFGAQAGIITLDDFSINQALQAAPPLPANNVAGPGTYFVTRTLEFTAATGTNSTNQIFVGNGLFNINTGGDATSTSKISWGLNLTTIAAALGAATFVQITLDQVSIDTNTVSVGSAVRNSAGNGGTVTLYSGALGGVANPFVVTFASALDADSKWDNVKLAFSCRSGAESITRDDLAQQGPCATTQVPEPGTIALLGLGLLGAGALRRKVK